MVRRCLPRKGKRSRYRGCVRIALLLNRFLDLVRHQALIKAMKPDLSAGYAIFLDLDGTLVDLAPTPDEVRVAADLPDLLRRLALLCGGALAILSGRKLDDIDAITRDQLPAGAEHGIVLRDAAGKLHQTSADVPQMGVWRRELEVLAREMPGVLVETKPHTVVAHYRLAPDFGPVLRDMMERMIAGVPATELLAAHMAWEIRPHGAGKGQALRWFMERPPFAGRKPFFVGDDVTDEEAIEAARALGGVGLHVARDFDGSTSEVRAYLAQSLAGMA
jgi:trehalose 6-phosphate phosphatase